MNAAHEKMLKHEIMVARELLGSDVEGALVHLERAHVLGQASVRWHVLTTTVPRLWRPLDSSVRIDDS